MNNDSDAEGRRSFRQDAPSAGALSPDFTAQLLPSGRTQDRIRESLAVLSAISAGELLSDLPANSAAQSRHTIAVSLLSAVEVLLKDALRDLDE